MTQSPAKDKVCTCPKEPPESTCPTHGNPTPANISLQEIIREVCHDFENPKADSLNAQVRAEAKLTTLINEARLEEIHFDVNELMNNPRCDACKHNFKRFAEREMELRAKLGVDND
jgi:hypothetical protein